MTDITVKLKVFPESSETSLASLANDLRENSPAQSTVLETKRKTLGFEVEVLLAIIQLPDNGDCGTTRVEKELESMESVDHVILDDINRTETLK